MKRLLILNCLLFISVIGHSQPLYKILKGHNLKITPICSYSRIEVWAYEQMLDSLHTIDQDARASSNEHFKEFGAIADSITFYRYKQFIEQYGFLSIGANPLYQWMHDANNKFTWDYAMKLHYLDSYGYFLLHLVEQSIAQKHTCNENDLMDLFVSYLWRRTEFNDVGFHIVPLPTLKDSNYYTPYYAYALQKTMDYFYKRDNTFAWFYITGIRKMRTGRFYWSDIQIKGILSPAIKSKVSKYFAVSSNQSLMGYIIWAQNKDYLPPGAYSLLICTHPNFNGNPSYIYPR